MRIERNKFVNNSASVKGGAIYYDLYSPKGLLNNFFSGNNASYGSNYGSYPFKLRLVNDSTITLSNLVSGGELLKPILVGIYD
jgi:hypothetical protein